MKIAEDFDHYGRLEDVIELKYIGDRTVVLFKCYWYEEAHARSDQVRRWAFVTKFSILLKYVLDRKSVV